MTETTQQQHPGPSESTGFSLGTILFGLILLTLGLLWLLDVTDVLSITWTLVGAVMLILVGISLLVGAREGSHGGLVFLGVVLSVIVLFGTMVSWPNMTGGVGDRVYAPASVEEVEDSYNLGAGSMVVDLSEVDFPDGENEVGIQQGMGDLQVLIPDDIAYQVQWRVGMGDIQALERQHSGIGLNGTEESEDYDQQDRQLTVNIQLGMGSVEVLQ